jgi:hypothetical protein
MNDRSNAWPGDHEEAAKGTGSSDVAAGMGSKSDDEPMLYCPVCSRRLTARKCKLFCETCGYYMSCADYY